MKQFFTVLMKHEAKPTCSWAFVKVVRLSFLSPSSESSFFPPEIFASCHKKKSGIHHGFQFSARGGNVQLLSKIQIIFLFHVFRVVTPVFRIP